MGRKEETETVRQRDRERHPDTCGGGGREARRPTGKPEGGGGTGARGKKAAKAKDSERRKVEVTPQDVAIGKDEGRGEQGVGESQETAHPSLTPTLAPPQEK